MRLDLLAALSGLMIALQARANGELSYRLNNGLEAALVSFGSGLLIIAVISLFHKGIKEGITNLRVAVKSLKIRVCLKRLKCCGNPFKCVRCFTLGLLRFQRWTWGQVSKLKRPLKNY